MTLFEKCLPGGLIAATLLTGCGGDDVKIVAPDPVARAEILMSSERGMQSITLDSKNAYLALNNTASEGSAVMHTARTIDTKSAWQAVAMGECRLPVSKPDNAPRGPKLKQVAGKTLLMQRAWTPNEHTLCELDQAKMSFVPKDSAFNSCIGDYCEKMEVSDVQLIGDRLFADGGGAPNLQVSNDQGATWRPLMGTMEPMMCTNQAFAVVGGRLLTGGECPLDRAYVKAYQMNADNSALASKDALPITLPELENRNVHFITALDKSERVFAGIEGGLLRSDDGGRSFKFVFKHPITGSNYAYITRLLAPANKPNVIVASGFDKAKGLPFLAWSRDNGDNWIDLSSLLPGYKQTVSEPNAEVTSIAEDAQGRILATVNEQHQAKGRLVAVTLGKLEAR